ncbi:MAG TPA: hypothetical protein VGD56_05850 [Gemmatirosa sp.]
MTQTTPAVTANADAAADFRVLPIRALAYDGDAAFVVERASAPPVTAAHRFRAASAPVAARVAEQLRVARDLLATPGLDAAARAAVGRGLRTVVVELRELAESYDVAPVADVCRAREGGAESLDPRAVAGLEHVAHGLLGAMATVDAPGAVDGAAAPEAPARPGSDDLAEPAEFAAVGVPAVGSVPGFRPPTGPALVELLEHGISGIERWPGTPLDMPAVPTPPGVAAAPIAPDGIVPVETLVYHGRAALDRARDVRDALRSAPAGTAPDAELLAELFDLLDLAATD